MLKCHQRNPSILDSEFKFKIRNSKMKMKINKEMNIDDEKGTKKVRGNRGELQQNQSLSEDDFEFKIAFVDAD